MNRCPCGSGRTYDTCCEPFIKGKKRPGTAEELLRSRYSAFVKAEIPYIIETTHPRTRNMLNEEETRRWAVTSEWKGLEILNRQEVDDKVEIEFIATYIQKGNYNRHHEIATFSKEKGRWYFEDGREAPQRPIRHEAPQPGRNDPCPCGSGKKFKKCCGA